MVADLGPRDSIERGLLRQACKLLARAERAARPEIVTACTDGAARLFKAIRQSGVPLPTPRRSKLGRPPVREDIIRRKQELADAEGV